MKKREVRVTFFGGLKEIGKNMTIVECGKDRILIDAGLKFPEEGMLGIDYIIPDIDELKRRFPRLSALFLTHGHEDHVGAVTNVMKAYPDLKVYGSEITLGIVKRKLEREKMVSEANRLIQIQGGRVIRFSTVEMYAIHVNHSIPGSLGYRIRTSIGNIIHTGDFKIDYTPVNDSLMDLKAFIPADGEKTLLLMADSTNACKKGHSLSESETGKAINRLLGEIEGRVIISTFASNIYRVHQIVEAAVNKGRKVCIIGRSMVETAKMAADSKFLNIPEESVVDIKDLNGLKDSEVCIITTGSQGEYLAGLSRMSRGDHKIKIKENDSIIFSSKTIIGNERSTSNAINNLLELGATVIEGGPELDVHASGHAQEKEIQLVYSLCKPKFYCPVHGEYSHLKANKEIAVRMGHDPEKIVIPFNGATLVINEKGMNVIGEPSDMRLLIDEDTGNVLDERIANSRRRLAEKGVMGVNVVFAKSEKGFVGSLKDVTISTKGLGADLSAAEKREVKKLVNELIEKSLKDDKIQYSAARKQIVSSVSRYLREAMDVDPAIMVSFTNA